MRTFAKLRKLLALLGDYRDDPYLRAQAERGLGLVLLAEGFLGLENPFDGRKSRPGIFGALLTVIIGVVFLFAANSLNIGQPVPNEEQAAGKVVRVIEQKAPRSNDGSASDGLSCSLVASYRVAGRSYQRRSNVASSSYCSRTVGSEITIGYNRQQPQQSRVITGDEGWMAALFHWLPIAAIVFGGITLLLRSAALALGLALFLRGRRRLAENPEAADPAVLTEIQEQAVAIFQNRPPPPKSYIAPTGMDGQPAAPSPGEPLSTQQSSAEPGVSSVDTPEPGSEQPTAPAPPPSEPPRF